MICSVCGEDKEEYSQGCCEECVLSGALWGAVFFG